MKLSSWSKRVIILLIALSTGGGALAETAELQHMKAQTDQAMANPSKSIQWIIGVIGNESVDVVLHNIEVYRFYVTHALQGAKFKDKNELNQVIRELEIRRDGQNDFTGYLLYPFVTAGLSVAQMYVDAENYTSIEGVAKSADTILAGLESYFSKLAQVKGAQR